MRVLKKVRDRPAEICRNTRKEMLLHSEGMHASLRDVRPSREAQTERTTSAALGQRYSIDLTPGRIPPRPKHVPPHKTVLVPHQNVISEYVSEQGPELILPSTPAPFPYITWVTAFQQFKYYWNYKPPSDDDVYLTLNETEITNAQMHHMTHTRDHECYLTDNMLDTCLSILGTSKNILSSGIAIMGTVEAQICAFPSNTGKEAYARKYANTRIILMPINDAMGVQVTKEKEHQQLEKREGSHWMLLLFDRRFKRTYYYDSFSMGALGVQRQVQNISHEVLSMLGEDQSQGWAVRFQRYCPHQAYHNQCDDEGACGPFVWTMAKLCVEQLQLSVEQELPDLTLDFLQRFERNWNSAEARMAMRESVEAVRKVRDFQLWAAGYGARGSAEEGAVQVDQGRSRISEVVGVQTPESLARGDEYETETEGSLATVDSGSALHDEEPAP